MKRDGFWNLPNTLTVLRICAVPIVVMFLWDAPTQADYFAAFFVFIIAMLTDIVDGYLARKWDLVSPAGAYLDPMADKIMVTTVLVMMIPLGLVPAWLVALLLCREIAITGLRGIASQEGMILAASSLGKIKTSYQSAAIGFILWQEPIMGMLPERPGLILLYISTFFALISGADYFVQFFKQGASKPSTEG